jgi:uncharacterized protein (UPF0305 family)
LATLKPSADSASSPYFKLIALIIAGLMAILTNDIRDIKIDIKDVLVKQEKTEGRLNAMDARIERNTARLDRHDDKFDAYDERTRKFYQTYELKRKK